MNTESSLIAVVGGNSRIYIDKDQLQEKNLIERLHKKETCSSGIIVPLSKNVEHKADGSGFLSISFVE